MGPSSAILLSSSGQAELDRSLFQCKVQCKFSSQQCLHSQHTTHERTLLPAARGWLAMAPAPGQPATDPTLLNNALGSAHCCKERMMNISALLEVTFGSRQREELPPAKGSEKAEINTNACLCIPRSQCPSPDPWAGLGESHRQVWGHPLAAPVLSCSRVPLSQHPAGWELPVAQFPPKYLFPTALPYMPSSPQPQKCKSQIPPKKPQPNAALQPE